MSALKKITTKAKQLYKTGKYAKWTDAIKEASKSLHKGVKKVKNKIGALPIGFSGKIWGVSFKVINQFDIYNEVKAIVEDTTTGSVIVSFDGKKSTKDITDLFTEYIIKHRTDKYSFDDKDKRELRSRLLKFCTNMQKEVKDYNSGKKATIKKQPIIIDTPKHKKVSLLKKSKVKKHHTHYGKVKAHVRRVSGIKTKKKATPKSYHKDTKSHNVKISVMSGTNKFNLLIDKGINEFYVDKLKKLTEELATAEKRKYLLSIEWKKGDKNFKQRNLVFKNHYPKRIKMLKKMISETKKHIK